MIKPAARTTLYEEISKQIINIVKQGQWSPGEKIPGEVALSNMFEVSRNCMREALKSLELTGIVESKPGRGTYLSKDALKNIQKLELIWLLENNSSIEELMETRMIVEVQLIYLAALRADSDDIKRLEESLDKVKNAIKTKSYLMDIGIEFHRIIAEISKNRILSKFIVSITDELIAQRGKLFLSHQSEEELMRELKEHEEMVEYIKSKEAEKAKEAMYRHLSNAKRILSNENDSEE